MLKEEQKQMKENVAAASKQVNRHKHKETYQSQTKYKIMLTNYAYTRIAIVFLWIVPGLEQLGETFGMQKEVPRKSAKSRKRRNGYSQRAWNWDFGTLRIPEDV